MFNGMFAFAIWDSNKKRLLLARDRSGIKPLYYCIDGERLLFASEIKALLAYDGVHRELDPTSLSMYLERKVVFGERTFFAGINKLPPGHYGVFANEDLHVQAYYSFAFVPTHDARGFDSLFGNVVNDMLVADVSVGVFLSLGFQFGHFIYG